MVRRCSGSSPAHSSVSAPPLIPPEGTGGFGQTTGTAAEQEFALPQSPRSPSSQRQLHTIWHCGRLGTVHGSWCHLGWPSLHCARKIEWSHFPALLQQIPRVAKFPHKASSTTVYLASPCKQYSWQQQCLSDERHSEKKGIICYKPYHVLPQGVVSLRINRCINRPKYKSNLHEMSVLLIVESWQNTYYL